VVVQEVEGRVSARLYRMDDAQLDVEADYYMIRPATAHVTTQTRSCPVRCIHQYEVGVDKPSV